MDSSETGDLNLEIRDAIENQSDSLSILIEKAAKRSSNFPRDYHREFNIAISARNPAAVETFLKEGMPANMTIEGVVFTAKQLADAPELSKGLLEKSVLYNVVKENIAAEDPALTKIATELTSHGAITSTAESKKGTDLSSVAIANNDWPLATALCRIGVLPFDFLINVLNKRTNLPEAHFVADLLEAMRDVLLEVSESLKDYVPNIRQLKTFLKQLRKALSVILNILEDDRVQLAGHSLLAVASALLPEAIPIFATAAAVLHSFSSDGRITKIVHFVRDGVFSRDNILQILTIADRAPEFAHVLAWDKLISEKSGNLSALKKLFSLIWSQLMPKKPLQSYL